MIVRDEESMLEECLASLRGFVDEVVVCDTGSQDSTVAIAEASGARVVHAVWQDDFAAARNVALEACREADWVLWIDADERLDPLDAAQARAGLVRQEGEVLLVEIENRRGSGTTSISLGTRLFRPGALTFSGRIHEELRRVDGSAPDRRLFDGLRLTHLGYDGDLVSSTAKAERNLAIATSAFESMVTAKSALDLVRSLGLAGASPDRMADIVGQGLDASDDAGPEFVELLAMRANLALGAGDVGSAFADSGRALNLAPGHDVAAAVFARAAVDLGHDGELITAMTRIDSSAESIRIPANRAEALTLAAGAALRTGARQTAENLVRRAADLLAPDPERWGRLEAMLVRVDHRSASDLIASVAGERVVGSAEDVAPESSGGGALMGISLSFSGDVLPSTAERLAAWVPEGRRVAEWTGHSGLSGLLTAKGCSVTSLSDADVGLESAGEAGLRFDAVIGGIQRAEVGSVLDRLRRVIDPAGFVGLWVVGPDGGLGDVAGTDPVHVVLSPEVLGGHGFMPDPLAPAGVVAARPQWDAASFATTTGGPGPGVTVWSKEPIPSEVELAYRASIPGNLAVTVVSGQDPAAAIEAGSGPVVVTTPDVMPDGRWVQACLDAFHRDGVPASPRLIDMEHRVVHAGYTQDGRAIAAGEHSSAPFLQTDRRMQVLGAPYVAAASDVTADSTPVGRVVGGAVAVDFGSPAAVRSGVGIDEMFSRPVLFVGGAAPGRGHPDVEGEIMSVFERLLETGCTPVYQWEPGAYDADPFVLHQWRQSGAVVFAPSPLRAELDRFGPDSLHPRSDALAAAFDPVAVVYQSAGSLELDFPLISTVSTVASIYVGRPTAELSGRVDEVCSLGDVPGRIEEMTEDLPATVTARVPEIAAVGAVDGLVSIVIPVFNNWDLTVRCLESIERHTPQTHEVIVVDNGSTDGTAAGLPSTGALVVTNADNRGFPAAVNQGIDRSSGEFVCILNNDTEVTPGWLDGMLATLAVPGTGLVGPRSNRISGLQQVPGSPELTDRRAAVEWARQWRNAHRGRNWPIQRLVGFCLLARRSTFEELGGFDEGFGIGNFEDDELGWRVMDSGLALRVADDSVVLHRGGATFEILGEDYVTLLRDSRRRLGGRVHGAAAGVVAVVLSDGNPDGAAISAASVVPITDRVLIAERGSVASTQLAASAVRGGSIDVAAVDWASDEGAAAILGTVGESMALILGSSERIDNPDWGGARSELERLRGSPAEIMTPAGPEVRLVPADAESAGMIGSHTEQRIEAFEVVS